jgi:hypothetical protein
MNSISRNGAAFATGYRPNPQAWRSLRRGVRRTAFHATTQRSQRDTETCEGFFSLHNERLMSFIPRIEKVYRDVTFTNEEIRRYGRHLIMPEVTLEGQQKLKAARVIGGGGFCFLGGGGGARRFWRTSRRRAWGR